MHSKVILAGLLIAFSFILPAFSQAIDRTSVWEANKQMVVKIKVTGRNAAGVPIPPRGGSGVVVRPDGTMITALHVVGDDADWFDTPGGRDRHIEVIGLDNNGVERSLGSASARQVPSLDIAILKIAASNLPSAIVADAVPSQLSTVVAIRRDPDSRQPEPVSGDLVPTDRTRVGDNLTVRLAVTPGDSGSGVFGADNKLVGIITNQLPNNRVLAVPAYAFASLLAGYPLPGEPTIDPPRPSPRPR
jgi:S1-C subfamily serine protease